MSMMVLTVADKHGEPVTWYFDEFSEYRKAVALLETANVKSSSVEDYVSDFSEFQSWLQEQMKTDDA